jgi:hypothetical protein
MRNSFQLEPSQARTPFLANFRFVDKSDGTRKRAIQKQLIMKQGPREISLTQRHALLRVYASGQAGGIRAMPPSTNSSLPVMKLLPSEARNEATATVSFGLPGRQSGA